MPDNIDAQLKSMSLAGIKDFFLNFLIPLVCLLASGALIMLVAYPSFKGLKPAQAELQSKRDLSAQLNTKLTKLNNLVDYKSVVDENANLVQRLLVDEALVPQLLTQIHQIATDSGLKVKTLSYSITNAPSTPQPTTTAEGAQQPATKETYKKVDVSLGVTGNYDQIVAFLENIENASRLVLADGIRFTPEKEDTTNYMVSIGLISPYLKIESSAVTDDPIKLDMSDPSFVSLINKIKDMRYYDISLEEANLDLVKEAKESTPSQKQ